MISAKVDIRAAAEKLESWRSALHARVGESVVEGAKTLLDLVRAKVSGEVLHASSGALGVSLRAEVCEAADGFAARVWSDGSVAYARIQEYGGRIALPAIAARNAKALSFVYGGRMVFAKRVAAHVIDIPEHAYMRASLAEFAPVFLDGIRKLATDIQ